MQLGGVKAGAVDTLANDLGMSKLVHHEGATFWWKKDLRVFFFKCHLLVSQYFEKVFWEVLKIAFFLDKFVMRFNPVQNGVGDSSQSY